MEFIEGQRHLTEYKDWLTSWTQESLQDPSGVGGPFRPQPLIGFCYHHMILESECIFP